MYLLLKMSGIVQVWIMLGETAPPGNVAQLQTLFSNQLFQVLTYRGESENYSGRVKEALTLQQRNNPNNPCIVVKDSSISILTPDLMATYISTALSYNQSRPTYSAVYLTHWLDECNRYKSILTLIAGAASLKQTFRPTADQCILMLPDLRDQLLAVEDDIFIWLNSQIASQTIKAATFVPNLVEVDISTIANNNDYFKLNQCLPVQTTSEGGGKLLGTMVFIFIAILLIVLAYCLIKIGPKYRHAKKVIDTQ